MNEHFIWDEKNLTEQLVKSENNGVNDHNVIMNETKTNSTLVDWKDITDPKLRRKMREKAYREVNKDKIKQYKQNYYETNKTEIKLQKKVHWESNKEIIKLRQNTYRKNNKNKIKEQNKTYYESNKDTIKTRIKSYRELNLEKIKLKSKKYYENNKNSILKKSIDYYNVNKEKKKEYDKVYNKLNKKKRNDYKSSYRKNNIQYKLSCNLRSRLKSAIRNDYKSGSAVRDLGCTISELKTYLESKFQTGMSWDNYGLYGWHIDHIKPLASFDLTDRKQLLEACHYTNLQPLWSQDNLSKSDKY